VKGCDFLLPPEPIHNFKRRAQKISSKSRLALAGQGPPYPLSGKTSASLSASRLEDHPGFNVCSISFPPFLWGYICGFFFSSNSGCLIATSPIGHDSSRCLHGSGLIVLLSLAGLGSAWLEEGVCRVLLTAEALLEYCKITGVRLRADSNALDPLIVVLVASLLPADGPGVFGRLVCSSSSLVLYLTI
jgi:hypothetical protein